MGEENKIVGKLIANEEEVKKSLGITSDAEKQDEEHAKKEIVARDDVDVFRVLDTFDDELIISELQGLAKTEDKWVYAFSSKDGKAHYELTKEGIDEGIRQLTEAQRAFMREKVSQVFDDERDIKVIVNVERYAIDKSGQEALLDSRIGAKRQDKFIWNKFQRKYVLDPFYFEKALQKAIRNANKRFIPTEMKNAIVSSALSGNKVQYLNVKYKEELDQSEDGAQLPEQTATDQLGVQQESDQHKTGMYSRKPGEPYKLTGKQRGYCYSLYAKLIDPKNASKREVMEDAVNKITSSIRYLHGEKAVELHNVDGREQYELIFPDRDSFQDYLELLKSVKSIGKFNDGVEKLREKVINNE